MARNYYEEWYDLMRMQPQFYQPVTGAAADTFHKGLLWGRPENQSNAGGLLGHPLVSPTNLGVAQASPYIDRIRQANLPAPENKPAGLLGNFSNVGSLIGDNKMAAALIALRGLEAGSRGQNIFQAAAPSVAGGLSDSFIIEKYKDIRKKSKAKEKIQESKYWTPKQKEAIAAGIKLASDKSTAKQKEVKALANIMKNGSVEEKLAAQAVLAKNSKTAFISKIQADFAKAVAEGLMSAKEYEEMDWTIFEKAYDKNAQIYDSVNETTVINKSKRIPGESIEDYLIRIGG
jgi:hypothetical protein